MKSTLKSGLALALAGSFFVQVAFADGLLPPKEAPKAAEAAMQEVKPEAVPVKAAAEIAPATPETVKVDKPVQTAKAVRVVPQIDATKSLIQLHSRLRKEFTAYAYTVSNNTGGEIELLHAEIVNGMNGQGAALGVQKSSAGAIGALIGGGLLLGIVTFGITFLAGLLASPIVYAVNHHGNHKAIAEGMPYSNQVPTGVMADGDSIQFTTLTPLNQNPQVKMTFRNLATNEIFSVTK